MTTNTKPTNPSPAMFLRPEGWSSWSEYFHQQCKQFDLWEYVNPEAVPPSPLTKPDKPDISTYPVPNNQSPAQFQQDLTGPSRSHR
jgi:hypothetical protein